MAAYGVRMRTPLATIAACMEPVTEETMDRLHFAQLGQIMLLLIVTVPPAAATVALDSSSKSRDDRPIVVPMPRRFAPVAIQVAPPPLPK